MWRERLFSLFFPFSLFSLFSWRKRWKWWKWWVLCTQIPLHRESTSRELLVLRLSKLSRFSRCEDVIQRVREIDTGHFTYVSKVERGQTRIRETQPECGSVEMSVEHFQIDDGLRRRAGWGNFGKVVTMRSRSNHPESSS